MFDVNEDIDRISFEFSSEMSNVNRVIEESHIFFHQLKIGSSQLSNLNLVLRELVNNAIEHGSLGVPGKLIKCTVDHLGKKRFKIVVEDEGEGFDRSCIDWEIPPDPRQTRNRGYALINAFCDQIKFNEKGNKVTVFINLVTGTGFEVNVEGDYHVIIPGGDITAAAEKEFRSLLESLLEKGGRYFRFDFKHVEDIDSVSLSVMIVFSKMLSKMQDWKLEIINLNRDLLKLFQLTRVNRIFTVLEDEVEEIREK